MVKIKFTKKLLRNAIKLFPNPLAAKDEILTEYMLSSLNPISWISFSVSMNSCNSRKASIFYINSSPGAVDQFYDILHNAPGCEIQPRFYVSLRILQHSPSPDRVSTVEKHF